MLGATAHLSAHQFRGTGGYPATARRAHYWPPPAHSLGRDSRQRGGRTPAQEWQAGTEVQRPSNPRNTTLTGLSPVSSAKGRKPCAPLHPLPPATQSGSYEACPLHATRLAPSQFSLVGKRPGETGAVTLKQAVTMVIMPTPFHPLRNFSISRLSW